MAQLNITLDTELLYGIFAKDSKDEVFSKLLEKILNQVLLAQSAEQLGAGLMNVLKIAQHTEMDSETEI